MITPLAPQLMSLLVTLLVAVGRAVTVTVSCTVQLFASTTLAVNVPAADKVNV